MKEELFKELIASVREGGAFLRGAVTPSRRFTIDETDIRRIRENYRLSQGHFAGLLGISVSTLQNWEQGRRVPKGPARVLLQVAAKHPDAVWDVVKPGVHASAAKAKRARTIARAARTNKTATPKP